MGFFVSSVTIKSDCYGTPSITTHIDAGAGVANLESLLSHTSMAPTVVHPHVHGVIEYDYREALTAEVILTNRALLCSRSDGQSIGWESRWLHFREIRYESLFVFGCFRDGLFGFRFRFGCAGFCHGL